MEVTGWHVLRYRSMSLFRTEIGNENFSFYQQPFSFPAAAQKQPHTLHKGIALVPIKFVMNLEV